MNSNIMKGNITSLTFYGKSFLTIHRFRDISEKNEKWNFSCAPHHEATRVGTGTFNTLTCCTPSEVLPPSPSTLHSPFSHSLTGLYTTEPVIASRNIDRRLHYSFCSRLVTHWHYCLQIFQTIYSYINFKGQKNKLRTRIVFLIFV